MLIVNQFFSSDSNTPAIERLISRKFVPHELPTLIEQFLMCADVGAATRRLPKDDAQTFINVIDEARRASIYLFYRIGVDTFRLPGTRYARSFTVGSETVSQTAVQDLWPLRSPSKISNNSHLLRPN